jgi:hypothetical protein
MGQGPTDVIRLHVASDSTSSNHLIVDTGASHVLLRLNDSCVLAHVKMSQQSSTPFAILKAANGAFLNSIGRGMLTIGPVAVIAYIFRDKDLVNNLLGIAPFANRGCTAMFTASQFSLLDKSNKPILAGSHHAHNL